LARAEELLEMIAKESRELSTHRERVEAEIEKLRHRSRVLLAPFYAALAEHEKELLALMKREKDEIFGKLDRVELRNGVLLHGEEVKISIPRNALGKIEACGWEEAIRVAKSVDRSVVESWSDERLSAIGATRKPVESFSYELLGLKGKEGG
jgi:hypothetical protein